MLAAAAAARPRKKIMILSHGDHSRKEFEFKFQIREGNRTFWYYDPTTSDPVILALNLSTAQRACYITEPEIKQIFNHEVIIPNVILRPLQDDTPGHRSIVIDCSTGKVYGIFFDKKTEDAPPIRYTYLRDVVQQIEDTFTEHDLDIHMVFCAGMNNPKYITMKKLYAWSTSPAIDIQDKTNGYIYEAAHAGRTARRAKEASDNARLMIQARLAEEERLAANAAAAAAAAARPLPVGAPQPPRLTPAQELIRRERMPFREVAVEPRERSRGRSRERYPTEPPASDRGPSSGFSRATADTPDAAAPPGAAAAAATATTRTRPPPTDEFDPVTALSDGGKRRQRKTHRKLNKKRRTHKKKRKY